jgi:hypothetical protein
MSQDGHLVSGWTSSSIRVRAAEEGPAKSSAKMLTNFGDPHPQAGVPDCCTLYFNCILSASLEYPEQDSISEGHAVALK